ncbi:MAG: hypothetical protein P1U87_11820 [Verrucomicrobiales bacterium]|nr:hypothetical protein [Verrucomicrobiales bacterium]
MLRPIAGALFLAISLAISLGLPAQIEQICLVSLAPCDGEFCEPDCCEESRNTNGSDCCVIAEADWDGFPVPAGICLSIELQEIEIPALSPAVIITPNRFLNFTRDSPDPPPLSGRERLTVFERQLV